MTTFLTRVIYTGDGSTTDFTFAFPYIAAAYVKVQLDGVDQTNPTVWALLGQSQVRFVTAPASGVVITILRQTSLTRIVDWTTGSVLLSDDLDKDALQSMHLIEEMTDSLNGTLVLDTAGVCWDAQNKRLCNLAPATVGTDAINLTQANALLFGAGTAEINNVSVLEYSGDGAETEFVLTGLKNLQRGFLFVQVEGYPQRPVTAVYDVLAEFDAGYPGPVGGDDYLVFATAPPAGSNNIVVRVVSGSILAVVGNGVIVSANLADDSVTLDKLGFVTGAAGRFMRVDAVGVPTLIVPTLADISGYLAQLKTELRPNELALANANLDMANFQVANLPAPANGTHATNRDYVIAQRDSAISTAQTYTDNAVGQRHKFTAFVPGWVSMPFVPDRIEIFRRKNPDATGANAKSRQSVGHWGHMALNTNSTFEELTVEEFDASDIKIERNPSDGLWRFQSDLIGSGAIMNFIKDPT